MGPHHPPKLSFFSRPTPPLQTRGKNLAFLVWGTNRAAVVTTAMMDPVQLIGHGTEAWIQGPGIGTAGMIHLYVPCDMPVQWPRLWVARPLVQVVLQASRWSIGSERGLPAQRCARRGQGSIVPA